MSKINRFDAVFVPSRQNKQALRNSGVKVPIYIVPHGVNAVTFHPRNPKLGVPNTSGKFVFVSVFGFQHRKNPEALLKAYWEAFSASDKVHLVIKTNGYARHENQRWIQSRILTYKMRLGIRKRTAPVTILARPLNQQRIKGIYTLGHAFVLPTRGEGVGLPFLESLASGTPVIATGWGGHRDFLTSRNSFFVGYRLRHPSTSMNRKSTISRTFRSLFAGKNQLWAEADIDSLKRQMRAAYSNPSLCKRKGRQGRRDALRLSWGRAGITMKRAIEKVIGK
jgi:glycosyltransferase involved in cell wall biosynthesis